MAREGGFPGLSGPIAGLAYWRLGGRPAEPGRIVALDGSEVTLAASDVFTGKGGHGGMGGTGQPGGVGHEGGDGGKHPGGGWNACRGGRGGNGGRGGDAGGGLGGPSVGFAYVVPNFTIRPGVTFVLGDPGEGGRGGNANQSDPAGKGADGVRGEVYRFGVASEPPH